MTQALRYWEDLVPGEQGETPSVTPTREAIIEFAMDYDPQPFHLDDEAARDSLFGSLAASGWHTISLMGRLLREHCIADVAWQSNLGMDKVRWKRPVRPDIPLRLRYAWRELLPGATEGQTGQARLEVQVLEGDEDVVAAELSLIIEIRRRPL